MNDTTDKTNQQDTPSLDANTEPADMILPDVMMPQLSGEEVLEKLKKLKEKQL